MRSRRPVFTLAVGALLLLAATLLVRSYQSGRQEEKRIRARYQQMRVALSSGDTNVARSLFAPHFRGGAHRSFVMLDRFAKPLGRQSAIRFSRSQAPVCPERLFHDRIIPGGHTIEMVRVDGQWFFTGKVQID